MNKISNRKFAVLSFVFIAIFLVQFCNLIIKNVPPLYICIAVIYSCFSVVLIQREFINMKRLLIEVLFCVSVSFFSISFSFYSEFLLGVVLSHLITGIVLIGITIFWQFIVYSKQLITKFNAYDLLRRILFFILFALSVLYIMLFLPEQNNLIVQLKAIGFDGIFIFQYIFPLVVGTILTNYILYYFEPAYKHETIIETRQKAHQQIYFKTFIVLFASACFILLSFVSMFDIKNITLDLFEISLMEKIGVALFILWAAGLIILRTSPFKTKIRNDKLLKPLSILSVIFLYAIVNGLLIMRIFANNFNHNVPAFFVSLILISMVCVAGGVSFIICKGFLANLCYIQNIVPLKYMIFTAILIGANIFVSIIASSLFMLTRSNTPLNILEFSIGVLTMFLAIHLIPVLISLIYKNKLYTKEEIRLEPHLAKKTIFDGIFQDGLTFTILSSCILGFTSFCYVITDNSDVYWFALSFLFQISWAVFFALKNNVERGCNGLMGTKYDDNIWRIRSRELKNHLNRQNKVCIFICMPYILIKIVWDMCKLILKGETVKPWKEKYFSFHDDNFNN